MGHLTRKDSLAVNEILKRVNSEKTYFVYTDKTVRILKVASFLLIAFLGVKQFYSADSELIQVRPVEQVAGQSIYGEPLKNVDLIDLAAVKPFMKKRTESELKIKGLVSAVAANGQLEMILEDGSLLKVNHQMKIEQAQGLVAKEVVMAGKIYKIDGKAALVYDANSLTVL